MIVLSMVLVLLGAVTLVLGFFVEDQPAFIYTTIGSASLAALLLVVAIARQRSGDRQPALAMAAGDVDERSWAGQPWAGGAAGGVQTLERRADPEFLRPGSPSGDPEAPLYRLLDAEEAAPSDEVEHRASGQWWTSEPAPSQGPPARSALDLGLDSGWPSNSERPVGEEEAEDWDPAAVDLDQGAEDEDMDQDLDQGAERSGYGAVSMGHAADGVAYGAVSLGHGAAGDDDAAEDASAWANRTEARFWQDSWHDPDSDQWALDDHEPPLAEPDPEPADAPAAGGAAIEIPSADRETERLLEALRPIRGVGPSKQSELLAYFKTLRRLRNASVERISEVPGISPTLAQRIHSELHS